MSWQKNLDGTLKKGNVDEGLIMNFASGEVYAKTANFSLSTHKVNLEDETGKKISSEINELEMLKKILNGVKGEDIPSPPGIWLNKNKCMLVSFDSETNTAYFKTEKGGIAVIKTNKLLLIGTWSTDKKQVGGNCNEDMDLLAKNFLKIDS